MCRCTLASNFCTTTFSVGARTRKAEEGTAESYAGIAAFDLTAYQTAMTKYGEFECNVLMTEHKLLTFEHSGVYPAKGSI
jgi:hypothetical protein